MFCRSRLVIVYTFSQISFKVVEDESIISFTGDPDLSEVSGNIPV